MSIYLDTCLVSGLFKQDLQPPDEQSALMDILLLHKSGEVRLVTSEETRKELDRIPEEYRAAHYAFYNLLSDVPYAWIYPIFHPYLSPADINNVMALWRPPEYLKLKEILPDETDVVHVFQAIRNSCDVFLTTDRKTILSKRAAVEEIFPIKLLSPVKFLKQRSPASAKA